MGRAPQGAVREAAEGGVDLPEARAPLREPHGDEAQQRLRRLGPEALQPQAVEAQRAEASAAAGGGGEAQQVAERQVTQGLLQQSAFESARHEHGMGGKGLSRRSCRTNRENR